MAPSLNTLPRALFPLETRPPACYMRQLLIQSSPVHWHRLNFLLR
jgi:hypothetical protein